MATAKTVLTSEFFLAFSLQFPSDIPEPDEETMTFFSTFRDQLAIHASLNYGDLPFWDELDDLTVVQRAQYAFSLLGHPLSRMYHALIANYNPLENYFTDRDMTTDASNTQTKTGDKDVQKTGQISTEQGGTKTRTYNQHGNVGQSTSFESYGDDDFANVSKNIMEGSVQDGYENYGSTTTYGTAQNPMSEKTVYDVTTEDTGGETVEEHRSGNSGIFSKQDLTQRELTLRQTNLYMKTAVRMFVDAFNTGVW